MPFRSEVYLEVNPIKTWWLAALGGACMFWKASPVHCRLYWGLLEPKTFRYSYFMTELTSSAPSAPGCKIVGRGDGYTIQITPVDAPAGTRVDDCDTSKIDDLARSYASVEKGNYSVFGEWERQWSPEPQGYGGPMYEASTTSNTYAYWILSMCARPVPPRPCAGAIGWGTAPMFPKPKS